MDERDPSDAVCARAPRILICDDSPIDRNPLSTILHTEGYETLEAAGGEAALKALKTHEVDLVLLDLNMPSVSGFEVLAYMQEHRRGLPVIVMSGLSPGEIQSHIHDLPESELPPLLLKPVEMGKLMPLIELLLSHQLDELESEIHKPEGAA